MMAVAKQFMEWRKLATPTKY